MTFEALYFDGITTKGHRAKVKLDGQSIGISVASDDGTTLSFEWDLAKVHPVDLGISDKVILKYGDYPFQYLEVNDPTFSSALRESYPSATFHKSTYNFFLSSGFKGIVALGLGFLGLLLFAYLVVLPAAAEKLAEHLPAVWEEEIGEAAYTKMVDANDIDAENSERLNAFFKKLHYRTGYNIRVTVAKDQLVNAYALPGGRIVVFEGILRSMDSYEELSALLSHEFSHVELKHSTRNIFRSLSSYIFISVLFGDASGATAVIIQNANDLKQLGYSRGLEEEADKNGLRLLKQRHIDPQGMERLFEALKKEETNLSIPQFLSTHPLTGARIGYVKEEIARKDYTVTPDAELDSLWKEIKKNLQN